VVIGIFSVTSFRSHYGPGVDHVFFLGVKAAGV